MRIIAGSLKGRRLKAPTWDGLRPTSDQLRETLFNVLAPRLPGARVLDGFAGTGALGIEALSRGAATVTFMEVDRRAIALIEQNLAHCGVAQGYAIIRASVITGIDRLRANPACAPFDIILLDPPYEDPFEEVLGAARAVAARDGIVVLEHAKRRSTPAALPGLVRVRQVVSGDSALALYDPTTV